MKLGLPAATQDAWEGLPTYDLDVRINSRGRSVREHAASATGYFKSVAEPGFLDLAAMRFFTRDFAAQVLETVNPFVKNEAVSHLACAGLLIEIQDGVLFGDPAMIFQTDRLNIFSVAKVDLDTEKLNATFRTQARRGLGIGIGDIVSPFTEIGGTLASPRLQLNSTSAVFRGSATLATGGISFLVRKAHERVLADKNPCRTEVEAAEADLAGREIAVPPD